MDRDDGLEADLRIGAEEHPLVTHLHHLLEEIHHHSIPFWSGRNPGEGSGARSLLDGGVGEKGGGWGWGPWERRRSQGTSPQSAPSASSTASSWPSTVTLFQTLRTLPLPS